MEIIVNNIKLEIFKKVRENYMKNNERENGGFILGNTNA